MSVRVELRSFLWWHGWIALKFGSSLCINWNYWICSVVSKWTALTHRILLWQVFFLSAACKNLLRWGKNNLDVACNNPTFFHNSTKAVINLSTFCSQEPYIWLIWVHDTFLQSLKGPYMHSVSLIRTCCLLYFRTHTIGMEIMFPKDTL